MKAVIFGATGMVGGEVLEQCLADDKIESILTIGRRISGADHPKLREIEHSNFLDFSALQSELSDADVCFYCLGVYQAQVSKDQFWEITVDYLDALVRAFERVNNNNVRFCLFSAQGASTSERSPIRFANAKGRAENVLRKSKLAAKYIFRPGYIMPGPRSSNVTLSAKLFEPIYRLFPMIGIDAPELARVMVDVGINQHEKTVFENRDIRGYGASR
jgi:uncharacterized protein YbjT (DUF2867 family)